ncbi:Os01g0195700 [Oryza sativa Japonica Group]|uniref:Uncharacterized protein n=2 Tax=Oryza sativa subsp. japonica TaxID=39947 RepID=A0A8J8Y942_ORYSJ|nr:hypothetical protein OsJ_00273 [Oryza sativa Japonica Group]KAB8080350.1 hypothetical protein EE612_000811 [Oryza sativa]BAS70860.1 Os01g0195700 [Oryza sativa Japonica Group]
MDSGGWIVHGYTNGATATGAGNHGFTCGYAASSYVYGYSCGSWEFEQREQQFISSQIQHRLNEASLIAAV